MKEYIYSLGAAQTNAKLLRKQISDILPSFVEFNRDIQDKLHIVFTDVINQSTLDTIIANHDYTQMTAEQQAQATEDSTRSVTRSAIVTLAQSAVGVKYSDLTANQRNAIIVCIAYKIGALDKDGNVKPLNEWLS